MVCGVSEVRVCDSVTAVRPSRYFKCGTCDLLYANLHSSFHCIYKYNWQNATSILSNGVSGSGWIRRERLCQIGRALPAIEVPTVHCADWAIASDYDHCNRLARPLLPSVGNRLLARVLWRFLLAGDSHHLREGGGTWTGEPGSKYQARCPV
jgi:hypothetical protein